MNDLTECAIRDALKSLLKEKPLSRITIRDISERCGISRMTFYYHFRDIYDLIARMVSSSIMEIVSSHRDIDTWEEGMLAIFKAVEDESVLILNTVSSIPRAQLERILTGPVEELILSVISDDGRSQGIREEDREFIASFYSYAFIGILLDWIQSGMAEDPEIIMDRIEKVMDGAFERAVASFSLNR